MGIMQTVPTVQRNIREICAEEEKALASRSIAVRIGDVIATQAGKMWFIVVHVIWFAVWLGLNAKAHGKSTFDPFPFALLTMIVSLESISFRSSSS
jgi:uncharacterized membrane protein